MTSAAVPASSARPAYVLPLRWLHWTIAVLIVAAIVLGVTAIYLPRGPVRVEMLGIHKSIGLTVLGLVVLRILARLLGGTPEYRPMLSAFNRHGAAAVHLGLYALMFAVPISGYVHSSAGDHPFDWFGLYPVPQYIPTNKAIDEAAGQGHYVFALLIVALLAAHLIATAWHAWVKKDGVFERMWPRG